MKRFRDSSRSTGLPLPARLCGALLLASLAAGCGGDAGRTGGEGSGVDVAQEALGGATAERVQHAPPPAHTVVAMKPADDPGSGDDDAAARAQWLQDYYGGDPTLSYLRYKAQVASEVASGLHGRHPMIATPAWTNIGPFAGASQPANDGTSADAGRVATILTHPTNPQILYVAAAEGGVFKSTNADPAATGDWTWTAITDSLPASSAHGNVSVGDLAMSPTDPNTLFLGLGDAVGGSASVGFFTSSDGGTTWTAGGTLGGTIQIWKILPLSSSVLLVGTAGSGLFRSTDGGHSFTQVTFGAGIGQVHSLAQFSNGTIVASNWTGTGLTQLYYSTDQGLTWTASTVSGSPVTGGLDRVTLATAGTGSAVGYMLGSLNGALVPGVFKTTDSGHTWAYVTPGASGSFDTGQGWYNQLITVDPANPSTLWVGAQFNCYRSMDAGVTWTPAASVMHADFHAASWSKTGTKTLYIGNDGGIAVIRDPLRATIPTTTDLTYLDNRRNRGMATHEVYYMSSTTGPVVTDAKYRVSIGLQDDGFRVRTDAGSGLATSGLFDTVQGGDGFGTLYHPYLPNEVLGSINGSLFLHTDGATFDQYVSPGPLLFGVVAIPDPSDVTGNGVLTIGQQGTPAETVLYRSHDFGQTFTTITSSTWASGFYGFWAAVPRTSASTIALIGSGTASNSAGYITSDGGATWTPLGAVATVPRSASFDSNDASVLYVTSVGYDPTAHHVWKSTDKGATFTALDTTTNGFPYGMPVYLVKNDPFDSAILYAATEIGMYRSADGGATWGRFGTGFPLVSVHDFWEAPDGTVLRAGTYGRGVWEIPIGRTPNTMSAAISTPTTDPSVKSGAPVTFSGTSTDSSGSSPVTSFWLFGDGTSAIGTSVSHTFVNTTTTAQTYTVTFVATDSSGANAGATRHVTVQPADDFSLAVSNPNQVCPPPPKLCILGFNLAPGTTATGLVTVNMWGPDPQTVALSITSGLPAGVTATLSPTSLGAPGTSTLTLTAAASAPAGSGKGVLQGTSSTSTHTATVTVTVASTNPITNGDFEAGSLTGWTPAGTTSVSTTAHGGKYAAQVGSTGPTSGDSSIAQTFTAPSTGGSLAFWYAVHCQDTVTYDWAIATLKDNTAGTTATLLPKTCNNTGTWKQITGTLVASHSYTLTLTSHDDGYAGDPTYTLYDDVTVGAAPPPPPQPIVNGDFETDSLTPWTSAGSASVATRAHAGSYSAMVGLLNAPTKGDSSIAQTFTAPSTGGTLTFWYLVACNDTVQYDWATATLKDNTAGTTSTPLAKTCTNTGTWVEVSVTLVAGHTYTLTLVNHDDNYAGDATYTYYDDVAVH